MAIKRYYASADNTITNAFQSNLTTRATGANMGLSDILEVFSIYGQESSGSQELARALIKFDLSGAANTIKTDASAGKIKLSTEAQATITVSTTDVANIGDGDTIALVTTGGTTITVNIGATGATSTSAATSGNLTAKTFSAGSYANSTLHATAQAVELATVINYSTYFTATNTDNVITVTQVIPGATGNTTITIPELGASGLTKTDFTLGTDGAQFYSRKFNAEHSQTLPKNAILVIEALQKDWSEGKGLDMEGYTDLTNGDGGCNWVYAEDGDNGVRVAWDRQGGNFHQSPTYTASFGAGVSGVTGSGPTADLQVNVTNLVYQWYTGNKKNHGFIVRLTGSQEAKFVGNPSGTDHDGNLNNLTGSTTSYYTKKFFARGTEFFFKRPCLEARWNSAIKDDTGNVFFSSSLAPQAENLNTIYLYNYVRGQLRNIPDIGTGPIYVQLYSGSIGNTSPSTSSVLLPQGGGVVSAGGTGDQPPGTVITGGYWSTGIYTASFAITSSTDDYNPPNRLFSSDLTKVYAVWANTGKHEQTGRIEFLTSSFYPKKFDTPALNPNTTYASSITNLKPIYSTNEQSRFRVYVRQKDWNPTIYTKATTEADTHTVDSGSYKFFRIIDELEVIPFGTGSLLHTQMSYDVSGNYFDVDMKLGSSPVMHTE